MTAQFSIRWLIYLAIPSLSCTSPSTHIPERSEISLTRDTLRLDPARAQFLDPSAPLKPAQREVHWGGKISLLENQKIVDGNSPFYKRYETSCGSWSLENEQIINILSKAKPIDGADYHNDFDVLPCQVEGQGLTNDSTSFTYRINAGSGIVILMQDTSFYLGYYGDEDYFLVRAAPPE